MKQNKIVKIALSIILIFTILLTSSISLISAENVSKTNSASADETAYEYRPTIYIRDELDRDYRVWAWFVNGDKFFNCSSAFRPKSTEVEKNKYGFKEYHCDFSTNDQKMYCYRVSPGLTSTDGMIPDYYAYGDLYIDIDIEGNPSYYTSNPDITTTPENANETGLWIMSPTDNNHNCIKWEIKDTENYYLYLPSGLSTEYYIFHNYQDLKINNQTISSNTLFNLSDDSYELSGDVNGTLNIIKLDNTRTMFLDTPIDLPYTPCYNESNAITKRLLSNKDSLLFESGNCSILDEEGISILDTNISKLKGRGNYSWSQSNKTFGKYSFNLTIGTKTNIITNGAVKTKKYSVIACNFDQSGLRNSLTSKIASEFGVDYTPNFVIYNIYNNGMYLGTYSICEKVEVGSSGLLSGVSDLEKQNEKQNPNLETAEIKTVGTEDEVGYYKYVDSKSPSDITGGYLLEIELMDRFNKEASGFISTQGQCIVIKSPEYATKEEVEYIRGLFNMAEDAIYEDNPNIEEISKYIDVESFAKMFLIQELVKNNDSGSTSFYIYKESDLTGDGKLHATTPWDFDLALGQLNSTRSPVPQNAKASVYLSDPTNWSVRYRHMIKAVYSEPYNFSAQLCKCDAFWNEVYKLWNSELYSIVSNYVCSSEDYENSDVLIKTIYDKYSSSLEANESRWGIIENQNQETYKPFKLVNTGSTLYETNKYLCNWVYSRKEWINNNIDTADVLCGDANGNDEINIDDASTIQELLSYLIDDNDKMIEARSKTSDEPLSVIDSTRIQQYLSNIKYEKNCTGKHIGRDKTKK